MVKFQIWDRANIYWKFSVELVPKSNSFPKWWHAGICPMLGQYRSDAGCQQWLHNSRMCKKVIRSETAQYRQQILICRPNSGQYQSSISMFIGSMPHLLTWFCARQRWNSRWSSHSLWNVLASAHPPGLWACLGHACTSGATVFVLWIAAGDKT